MTPDEQLRQAAREEAQRQYDAGHRFTDAQLNLLTRTIGKAMAEADDTEAA